MGARCRAGCVSGSGLGSYSVAKCDRDIDVVAVIVTLVATRSTVTRRGTHQTIHDLDTRVLFEPSIDLLLEVWEAFGPVSRGEDLDPLGSGNDGGLLASHYE